MGMILREAVSPSAEIGILEITSSSAEELIKALPEERKPEFLSLKNEFRKKEILATKILIMELLGKEADIFYDKNGKPFLKNSNVHISLSHSGHYVAAISDKKNSTGIDIQKITLKIDRIKEKFLGKNELSYVSAGKNIIDTLHVLWGAKECIYKEHGAGDIVFSQQIIIAPFDFNGRGEIKGYLQLKNLEKQYALEYRKLNDYMLVYIRELANIVT